MKSNQEQKEQYLKLGFFKTVWYSIIKFEKYPEMAAIGVKKALIYFTKIMLIFSILFTVIYYYYVSYIAKYEDKDISFSKKIITSLVDENMNQNEKLKDGIKQIEKYSQRQIIIVIFISVFIAVYITTLLDVFTLSLFGLLTCWIAKIKMNYKAVFNMSIYALTLAIILRIIYTAVTMLTNFEIKYFNIMYTAISYISLAAAIFMIKSDLIKQHLELMRIIEEGKEKIENTITNPRKQKDEKKKDEEQKENENKNKKDEDEQKGTEEQGSNA